MSAISIYKGNTSPSLSDVISVNGRPFDLSGCSVKLQMRPDNNPGAALSIDADATIVDAVAGSVRYDWQVGDTDAPGRYRTWWEVTLGSGAIQDSPDFAVEILDHADSNPDHDYLTLDDLKSTLSIGSKYADDDLKLAITAASRLVDDHCHRRFWADATSDNVRFYTVRRWEDVEINDLIELVEMATDPTGLGTYSDVWTFPDDIYLDPPNASLDGAPYERIYVRRRTPTLAYPYGGYYGVGYGWWGYGKWRWPYRYPQGLRITGRFGWPKVPEKVQEAVAILAPRLLKRAREATWGIVGLGMEGASPLRLGQTDPDVCALLERLTRDQYFA